MSMSEARFRAFCAAFVFAGGLLMAPVQAMAQAQNLADAKCTDAFKLEAEDQRLLIVWLSGYFAGVSQAPTIDPAAIRNARQALGEICTKAPETRLLGPEARAAVLGQPAARP